MGISISYRIKHAYIERLTFRSVRHALYRAGMRMEQKRSTVIQKTV